MSDENQLERYQLLLAPRAEPAEVDEARSEGIGSFAGLALVAGLAFWGIRKLRRNVDAKIAAVEHQPPFEKEWVLRRLDLDPERHREIRRLAITPEVHGVFAFGPDGDDLLELRADRAAFLSAKDAREWAEAEGILLPRGEG